MLEIESPRKLAYVDSSGSWTESDWNVCGLPGFEKFNVADISVST